MGTGPAVLVAHTEFCPREVRSLGLVHGPWGPVGRAVHRLPPATPVSQARDTRDAYVREEGPEAESDVLKTAHRGSCGR